MVLPSRTETIQTAWPAPPETARVVYETTLTGAESLQPVQPKFSQLLTGQDDESFRSSLIKPYDVAAYGGLIAVSDTQARVVFVFDVPRRRFFPIGYRNQGQLAQPLGVAIDHRRNIYVADGLQNRVHVFDAQGHYLRSLGESSEFSKLTDVSVDAAGSKIFMLDRGGVESDRHRVLVYDNQNGTFVRAIGTRGKDDGFFNHPSQIVVSPQNELLVLDAGNFRVQIFDLDGKFLRSFGSVGNGLGQFARGRGLAVSTDGYILATDGAFQNFQIYSRDGTLMLAVGRSGGGNYGGEFLLPAGIATDETNRIYVVDQLLRKVDVFRFVDATPINN